MLSFLSSLASTLAGGPPWGVAVMAFVAVLYLALGVPPEALPSAARLAGVALLFPAFTAAYWAALTLGSPYTGLPERAHSLLSTPEGQAVLLAATGLYMSGVAAWTLAPGRAIPRVEAVAGFLRARRSLPLEAVAYALLVAGSRAHPGLLLCLLASAGAGAWAYAATKRPEATLLVVLVVYVAMAWVFGLLGAFEGYLGALLSPPG